MTKGKFSPAYLTYTISGSFSPHFVVILTVKLILDLSSMTLGKYTWWQMHKQLFNKVNFQHKVVSIDLNRQNICPIWRNGTKHSRYYWTDKNWGLIEKRMVDIGYQGQHAKMNTAITTGIQSARIGRLLNRISPWLDVIAYQSW